MCMKKKDLSSDSNFLCFNQNILDFNTTAKPLNSSSLTYVSLTFLPSSRIPNECKANSFSSNVGVEDFSCLYSHYLMREAESLVTYHGFLIASSFLPDQNYQMLHSTAKKIQYKLFMPRKNTSMNPRLQ